jgi:hypothetical protein
MGLATLDTTGSFSTFDVYFHDSKTDEWLVQSVGAPGNPNTLQTVPEPASGILLAMGMVLVILWALGRRRGQSFRGQRRWGFRPGSHSLSSAGQSTTIAVSPAVGPPWGLGIASLRQAGSAAARN